MYSFLLGLSRPKKYAIVLLSDAVLAMVALYVAFCLRFGTPTPYVQISKALHLFPLIFVAALCLSYFSRLHRVKLHAFENRAVSRVAICAGCLTLAAISLSYITQAGAPRSVPLILGSVYFILAVGLRLFMQALLNFLRTRSGSMAPVAIYGAGSAGIQLVSALQKSSEVNPVIFVDDNSSMWGLYVAGLIVKPPNQLKSLVESGRIEKVLIAMPSAARERQNEIIADVSDYGCEVQVVQSHVDIIAGGDGEKALRVVTPDELLGREKVDLDIPEVAKAYAGRTIMVTGAGGSIGSELCRQLANTGPAKVILFEQSEFALYSVDRDMQPLARSKDFDVVSRLGSVTDANRVASVMAEEGVDIVLHAAAYKHVPIVEENELEGARNNVLGTKIVAEAAAEAGVERFILVSTDKAVRPTNIMGATKRLAETVVQDIQTRHNSSKFAMVRFGNVLGSSGSVLPLFERQIRAGGPVTVTHEEVTRFFMTIPEAARLVLLAGAYAQGADVFVLDMGEPMKIIDIARRMILMSGRTVKENGEGDIEVKITGLRPGEKLYEELLIDDKSLVATPHPKILRAEEKTLSQIEVAAMLKELRAAIDNRDANAIRSLVKAKVDGYRVPDHDQRVS